MVQAVSKTISFLEFVNSYPEYKSQELHHGVVVEMAQPSGKHKNVTGFLVGEITFEFKQLKQPYFIASKVLVKLSDGESAYLSDILVLNKPNLVNEPLYDKYSTVTQAASIPLVIEVVSSNWSDDYALKFEEYSNIGIPEYWIVDYLGLGGKEFIGYPKQPTITVCNLAANIYRRNIFRNSDRIHSQIFPNLNLIAQQIFDSA
ncbi:Uma2 family endonuclease [Calothrix sp. NIES-3974]|uniref:Uma2 family endonuclease n=1 Tax=Calothrix sp. NIES-3974 TaxID=2005462 RepID=UPI000B613E7A|nr:Uma2 family endonuclease [Calothrix sp. NIES-3974]BAZ06250.1 hypothetical protein NIES3974_29080 [Calothrix sp. NIES-3974]